MAPPINWQTRALAQFPASSNEIAIFKADPEALSGLCPIFFGHGSTYRSSSIEFRANYTSVIGAKNLLTDFPAWAPRGSFLAPNPNI